MTVTANLWPHSASSRIFESPSLGIGEQNRAATDMETLLPDMDQAELWEHLDAAEAWAHGTAGMSKETGFAKSQAEKDLGGAKPRAAADGSRYLQEGKSSPRQTDAGAAKFLTDKESSEPGIFPASISGTGSKDSGSGFKMKASTPDDSVGQLAAMLARSENRLDVQQVYSKAMRALANLKMSALASDSGDAKKIAQMVRRMEKLIKRIQKKLKLLSKEEQMENQREKAEKAMKEQKEKQLREELRSRRNKRRREEREYAMKEMAEDNKTAAGETISSMINAVSPAVPDVSALTGAGSYTASAGFTADVSAVEGGAVDVVA